MDYLYTKRLLSHFRLEDIVNFERLLKSKSSCIIQEDLQILLNRNYLNSVTCQKMFDVIFTVIDISRIKYVYLNQYNKEKYIKINLTLLDEITS